MRYNRYIYTYLAISRHLVVFLHQILVAFASIYFESGLAGAAQRWRVYKRYLWDGLISGRGTQDLERSTQDPVGARRSYLSEFAEPMKIGATTNRCRPSPLVFSCV